MVPTLNSVINVGLEIIEKFLFYLSDLIRFSIDANPELNLLSN